MFSDLPNEILFDIGLLLPLPAIAALSLTTSRLNNLLANNNLYWKIRYRQDFGTREAAPHSNVVGDRIQPNWKEEYCRTGDLWVCGSNSYGQLGLGDNRHHSMLTQIPDIKVKTVACGNCYTVVIDFEDQLWVCGDNNIGIGNQLKI